ncbi:MAG: hypothetical protein KatS3mg003_0827 [Candidatus Nitrosocaldaceae archaeon]|nr:MAG: hypothetical protein KatS3mg003_0827 [Candidatus Nitrosocaldaceae archaeon]
MTNNNTFYFGLLLVIIFSFMTIDANALDISLDEDTITYSDTINATLRINLDSINGIDENIPFDSIINIVLKGNDTITNSFYLNSSVIYNDIINLELNTSIDDINYTDTFTIIDYKYLFNWDEITYNYANELPDNVKEFIDEQLEAAEENGYKFTNTTNFQLFKEQWRDGKVDVNPVRIKIIKEQVENGTAVYGNTIVIEVNRFTNYDEDEELETVLKIYDQASFDKDDQYTFELKNDDGNIYHPDVTILYSNNRPSISSQTLEYTIRISPSTLNGNYTLYSELDTTLGITLVTSSITFTVTGDGDTGDDTGDTGDTGDGDTGDDTGDTGDTGDGDTGDDTGDTGDTGDGDTGDDTGDTGDTGDGDTGDDTGDTGDTGDGDTGDDTGDTGDTGDGDTGDDTGDTGDTGDGDTGDDTGDTGDTGDGDTGDDTGDTGDTGDGDTGDDTGDTGDTGDGDTGDDTGDTGDTGDGDTGDDTGDTGDTGDGDTGDDTGDTGDTGDGDTGDDTGDTGDTGDGDTGDDTGDTGDTGDGDTGDDTGDTINSFLLDISLDEDTITYSDTINATLRINLDSINGIDENIPFDSIINIVLKGNDTITNSFYLNSSVIYNDIINLELNTSIDDINYTDTFTIIDYKYLFNWDEITHDAWFYDSANELPDNVKEFIDEQLEAAESIFMNYTDFQLFKEQWRDGKVDVNPVRVMITTEQISNHTEVIPNNIVIEFNRVNTPVFKVYHKQEAGKVYTYKLLERDNNLYHGIVRVVKSDERKSVFAPMILLYNITINTSKLEIGNYTLSVNIDTKLDMPIFKIDDVMIDIKKPSSLEGFDYVKLVGGYVIINYNDLELAINATKHTLVGIREITDPNIDLSSYNILSRIFEIKFYDKTKIDNIKVSIPHIITNEDPKLLLYNNGWIEAKNVTKTNNIMSGYIDNEGIVLIASKKPVVTDNDDNNDVRESTRRVSSGGTISSNIIDTSKRFPILVREVEPKTIFDVNVAKYGLLLDSLKVSLKESSNILYINIIIPDNLPFVVKNSISHFELTSSMSNIIDKIDILFKIDGYSDIKFYRIGNGLVAEDIVKVDDDIYKASINSLGEFVLVGIKESSNTSIESEAVFPSIEKKNEPIRDRLINDAIKPKEHNYIFDVYGYELKIEFSGTINIVDIKEDENSILLKVSNINSEKIVITLPRDIIDAKRMNGEDAKFIILIDGNIASYEEERYDDYRVIAIGSVPLKTGTLAKGDSHTILPPFNS